ncbi:MAG: hypothetical protein V7694_03540 [Rhodococcus sp. (in: high G+C Gram-positive bacteria)]
MLPTVAGSVAGRDVCVDIAAERISENWGLQPVAVVNDISGGQRVLAGQQSEGVGYSSRT